MQCIQNTSVELVCAKSTAALVKDKIREQENAQNDDAFFICDLGDIINKYEKWMSLLPRVKPFYAVKCCDETVVLKLLADFGAAFDCASKVEIEDILALGISASRVVYANPCKQGSYIKYAARNDISRMTFDNEDEIQKVKVLYPDAELIIRILPSRSGRVQFNLGKKFGCPIRKCRHLLETAKALELNVIGVSFHVGSRCETPDIYAVAIEEAREVFDIGKDLGFAMTILDIGGGFPGQIKAQVSFEEIAEIINSSLDKYFPTNNNVEVIAEAGRYFVASAFTLAVNIISKRTEVEEQYIKEEEAMDSAQHYHKRSIMYYVNAGVHGVFNLLNFDVTAVDKPKIIQEQMNSTLYDCSVWGPTCSSDDCIMQHVELPDLRIGSWLYFEDMGAYTLTLSSFFNGIPPPRIFYVCREDIW